MSLRVYTARELLKRRVTEFPMLIDNLLPKIGIGALAGGSDSGKSALLRQLSFAICNDEDDFLGFKLSSEKKSVTYVSTEDDDTALSFLLGKQNGFDNIPKETGKFYLITETNNKIILSGLDEHLSKNPCDLIIIDAVSDLIAGDMNSQTVVRTFMNDYSELAKKHNCCVLFLHHTTKSSKGSASKHSLSGSQGFEGKCRVVLMLVKGDGYNSLERNFNVVKGNYTPSEIKKKVYKLEFDEKTLTFTKRSEDVITSNTDNKTELYIRNAVLNMHKEGLSQRKIAEILTERGYKIGKSKVGEIIKSNLN